jgi:hypothetical protein
MATNYKLYINSKDRTIGTTTNFTVSFKEKILLKPNTSYHCYVESAEIPFTFYGINSTNNKFVYVKDGVSSTITIPVGNYTKTTFIPALETAINDNQLDITYSETTGKLTFTCSSHTHEFNFATLGGNAYSVLGFNENDIITFTTSVVSTNVANFITPYEKIYIRSSISSLSYDTGSLSKTDILEKIQIGNITPFDDTIYFRATEPYKALLTQGGFDTIYVKLTDIRGRDIDLNGQNWNLCVVVEQSI